MFKGKAIGKINDFQKDGGWVATNVQECTTTGKMGNVIILLNTEIPIIKISVSLSLNNLNKQETVVPFMLDKYMLIPFKSLDQTKTLSLIPLIIVEKCIC